MGRLLALVVVLSGCDLIFTPAPLASDAPASTDGPVDRDGPPIADASGDGPIGPIDGPANPDSTMPDATCPLFACNAPDEIIGTPSTGTAGCAAPGLCTGFPVLNSIDLCSCTAGQPELYTIPAGSFAQLGLVALAPSTGMYSLNVDGGACHTGAVQCPAVTCPGGFDLWVFDAVPVAAGGLNTIAIYEDDGSGCVTASFSFSVIIP